MLIATLKRCSVNLFCLIKGLKTGVTIHEIDEKFDEGNIF